MLYAIAVDLPLYHMEDCSENFSIIETAYMNYICKRNKQVFDGEIRTLLIKGGSYLSALKRIG